MTDVVREYFIYHLNDREFEDLVVSICKRWLGEGTTPFARGKDGGRDAKFHGIAQNYPSGTGPWNGHVVIQAKHTASPNASCSDKEFRKLFQDGERSEKPKIKRLIKEKLLDYYIVFTNRKLTGGADEKIIKDICSTGVKDAAVVGLEGINAFLNEHPEVAKALPTHGFSRPFEFTPDDMVEVISAVQDAIKIEGSKFSSSTDFSAVNKKNVKNNANRMSSEYYRNVIVNEYMPIFDKLRRFLENERNSEYRDIYHDIADELRQKIAKFRDNFECFEEVIIYIFDLVKDARPDMRGRRRYVTFLLCYMYDDCDIGERQAVS